MKDKETQECSTHFPGKRDIQSGRRKYGICQGDSKCKVGMTGKASPCQNEIFTQTAQDLGSDSKFTQKLSG